MKGRNTPQAAVGYANVGGLAGHPDYECEVYEIRKVRRDISWEGQAFAVIVIVLAAAEAAIALAIFLNFYNARATVDVDQANELKG